MTRRARTTGKSIGGDKPSAPEGETRPEDTAEAAATLSGPSPSDEGPARREGTVPAPGAPAPGQEDDAAAEAGAETKVEIAGEAGAVRTGDTATSDMKAGTTAGPGQEPEAPAAADTQPADTQPADAGRDPVTDTPVEAPVATSAEARAADADTPNAEQPSVVPAPPVVEGRRRGGFFAPFLGGVLAAGLGAGAVLYLLPQGWQPAEGGALASRLAALEARIESLPDSADVTQAVPALLAPLSDRLAEAETRLDQLATAVQDGGTTQDAGALEDSLAALRAEVEALTALSDRLTSVEATAEQAVELATEAGPAQPDGGVLAESVQSAVAEALEEPLGTALDARIAAAVEDALADATARQQALADEIDTAAAALAHNQALLAARTGLAALVAAADSGEPAPQALQGIAAVTDMPEGLDAFAEGITPLATLQASFPALSRAALQAAPPPPDAGVGDRVMGFLRQQTGARSLAPREGDDPDAVLSRAEAQLRAGDLAQTLQTLQALPPAATAVLQEWQAQAQARLTALQALEQVQADLGTE